MILSFNSLTVFSSFPNAFIIPIPFTYSIIFELKSNLSPSNFPVKISVFFCVDMLTKTPTIKVKRIIIAVIKSYGRTNNTIIIVCIVPTSICSMIKTPTVSSSPITVDNPPDTFPKEFVLKYPIFTFLRRSPTYSLFSAPKL